MGGSCAGCSSETARGAALCIDCTSQKGWASNLLGVGLAASESEVHRAFKRQAVSCHPDKCGNDIKFKEITKARNILAPPKPSPMRDIE